MPPRRLGKRFIVLGRPTRDSDGPNIPLWDSKWPLGTSGWPMRESNASKETLLPALCPIYTVTTPETTTNNVWGSYDVLARTHYGNININNNKTRETHAVLCLQIKNIVSTGYCMHISLIQTRKNIGVASNNLKLGSENISRTHFFRGDNRFFVFVWLINQHAWYFYLFRVWMHYLMPELMFVVWVFVAIFTKGKRGTYPFFSWFPLKYRKWDKNLLFKSIDDRFFR